MMQERAKGKTQAQAAARAGMSERTARKYERAGALPAHPLIRTHRTLNQPTRSRPTPHQPASLVVATGSFS